MSGLNSSSKCKQAIFKILSARSNGLQINVRFSVLKYTGMSKQLESVRELLYFLHYLVAVKDLYWGFLKTQVLNNFNAWIEPEQFL